MMRVTNESKCHSQRVSIFCLNLELIYLTLIIAINNEINLMLVYHSCQIQIKENLLSQFLRNGFLFPNHVSHSLSLSLSLLCFCQVAIFNKVIWFSCSVVCSASFFIHLASNSIFSTRPFFPPKTKCFSKKFHVACSTSTSPSGMLSLLFFLYYIYICVYILGYGTLPDNR